MPIYKVSYHSMTASYGPGYVQADSELEAKIKWAGGAFSQSEMGLISAVVVNDREIIEALKKDQQ
jgi:hypothetical protein